jgi:hypothetical protein
MLAVRNGNTAIVQLLLTHGANIQARDKVCLVVVHVDVMPMAAHVPCLCSI